MGTYVYKVTSKRVQLTDGTFANLAVFAYKPHSWDDKLNGRLFFNSRCGAADRFVKGKNYTGKVVTSYLNEDGKTAIVSPVAYKVSSGTFSDHQIDSFQQVGEPKLVDAGKSIAIIL